MADVLGNTHSMIIPDKPDPDGEGWSGSQSVSSSDAASSVWKAGEYDGVQGISVATHGKLLAFIFKTHCIFKSTSDGKDVGEISLQDSPICTENLSSETFISGGMFFHSCRSDDAPESRNYQTKVVTDNFVVWNAAGAAVIYRITHSINTFGFEPLCEIPAVPHPPDSRTSISFSQLNEYIVRIESISFAYEDSLLWTPHATIWLVSGQNFTGKIDTHGQLRAPHEMKTEQDNCDSFSCFMIGQGGFLHDQTRSLLVLPQSDKEDISGQSCSTGVNKSTFMQGEHGQNFVVTGRTVSSSLVFSEEFCSSYIIVYGYHNGEIEVVRLGVSFLESQNSNGSIPSRIDGHIYEQTFSGHTGAVLCLALHHMVAVPNDHNLQDVLISGSLDCTVRIWDLTTGKLVSIMHHHVAPIRQIIMPPPHTDQPWCNCFLTVSDDSAVALVSLESMQVVRMFPGHPCYPVMVAWDSARGYIACQCRNFSPSSEVVNVLYIWDVKTGARERVIRGTASQLMHILGGTTSASSLLFPGSEDSGFNQSQKKGTGKGMAAMNKKGNTPRQTADFNELDNSPAHHNKGKAPLSNADDLSYDTSLYKSMRETVPQQKKYPINCSCPFPGIAILKFDLLILMSQHERCMQSVGDCDRHVLDPTSSQMALNLESNQIPSEERSGAQGIDIDHAFYTRNLAEKIPEIKPPLLQILASFWQDKSEHVRMAARSLFHCAASRAIPLPLSCHKSNQLALPANSLNDAPDFPMDTFTSKKLDFDGTEVTDGINEVEKTSILAWLESYEMQDWVSCIGGTNQDAMASHIIVSAALAVWYPSIVKASLARIIVNHLIKLIMAMNDRYSASAAELLAEGMDSTWKEWIVPEIPRLIGDMFFQVECLSGTASNTSIQNPAVAANIREALIGVLLPSLAAADTLGFFNVIESQIWATSSDSPVHLVALTTLIRVIRSSPKPLAPYLNKTMDHGNLVMRKACLHRSMTALKEIGRAFPMVALNKVSTRMAFGDAVGDIRSATIQVYDIQSVTKIKVLDASWPPGLPSLLVGASNTTITTAISALCFSLDGEGLVAFSENGFMIRWWSLGTAWWEKLSRTATPVQCTKLIFVPPWEGFSPNSSRSSIMASIIGDGSQMKSKEKSGGLSDVDHLKLLLHNLDLSYRLEWDGERKVLLLV
ncbi:hypothetical protein QJS10_CPA03g00289 [Acorus calamus]|uniref:Transducin/WD40 repeat-like superfamily protein n=1 Tax=Acorus calamus TaxID=4465 RepID=A0AAV9F9C7_ACOCL|nr:hypothetical protein QJS10_CPA03g00289 [Acorus calamus]